MFNEYAEKLRLSAQTISDLFLIEEEIPYSVEDSVLDMIEEVEDV